MRPVANLPAAPGSRPRPSGHRPPVPVRRATNHCATVDAILKYLKSPDGGYSDWTISEHGKDKQHMGDISLERDTGLGEEGFTIEVKYDIMAEKTNNLCFETSNGKKITGVLATEADEIWYVVPNKEKFVIYQFITRSLVSWLNDDTNSGRIRVVNGGDKNKFILMLVKRNVVDSIAYNVIEVE